MVRTILTLLWLLACLPVGAQQTFWQQFYGGAGFDEGKKVLLRADGSLIVGGEYDQRGEKLKEGEESAPNFDTNISLFNFTTQGIIFWQKLLGGSGEERLGNVIHTRDGGYAFIATTDSDDGDVGYNHGGTDMWVGRIDARGNLLWARVFGGSGNDVGYSLLELAHGGFLIAGESGSRNGNMRSLHHGGTDAWVARIDEQGRLLWERHFGGGANERVVALHALPNERYLAVCTSDSRDGDRSRSYGKRDAWLIAFSEQGRMYWEVSHGGEDNDEVYASCITSEGNLALVGTTFSSSVQIGYQRGMGDVWVLKIDPRGGKVWSNTFGGRLADGANAVHATSDGGVVVAGLTRSFDGDVYMNNGYYDAFIFKINQTGRREWARTFGYLGYDAFYSLQEAPEGGFLALGTLQLPDDEVSVPGYNRDELNPAPLRGHGGRFDMYLVNFSDPSRRETRPYVTPPVLAGSVTETQTQRPIEAAVTLIDNTNLDSLAGTRSSLENGEFSMLLPAYGLVSLKILAKGYLFYGEDLRMDTVISKSAILRNIQLEPIRRGSKLRLDNIYFESGRFNLLPESRAELERLVEFLVLNDNVSIQISGHTDNTGETRSQVRLSEKRAEAVRAYLVRRGIDGRRLQTKGYGPYRPAARNTTEAGRRRNRRVEFEVTRV